MNAKIVTIIPVFNAEQFLERTLDSVINQTFKEIKIICVNDASTDKTLQILEEYAKKDERIVIINNLENKGPGNSRNIGLDYVYENLPEVEYISLVDADDRIEPNTYERAYEEAKKINADILNFNFLPSTYWEYKTEATSDYVDYIDNPAEAIFDHNEFYTFVVCWSKLYKKELLENIRFSGVGFYEDGGFAYKVYTTAKRLRVIPDTLYEYNIENSNSVSGNTGNAKRLESIFVVIKETREDWEKKGVFEKYKYKFIDHIILYTSLVAPEVLDGDYSKELEEAFDMNLLDAEIQENLKEETKAIILRMTTKK